MNAKQLTDELQLYADPTYAQSVQRFFKTGKGEYAEADRFIGIRVPNIRKVCKAYTTLPITEVEKILYSPIHEHRLAAVIIMRGQYEHADIKKQTELYELYKKGLRDSVINNWDIIDISAGAILGRHAQKSDQQLLITLAKNGNLWEKRAAIVATSAFISSGNEQPTFTLAKMYLDEPRDLLHKATGWMLREVGKHIGESTLTAFLDKHAAEMPRTMLRYACEKLDKESRQYYYSQKKLA